MTYQAIPNQHRRQHLGIQRRETSWQRKCGRKESGRATFSGAIGRMGKLYTHLLIVWHWNAITLTGESDIRAMPGMRQETSCGSFNSYMSCSMTLTTRAYRLLRQYWVWFWRRRPRIEINLCLWNQMIKELGRRGLNGRREAGAFLLVRHDKGDGPVVRVVYYDDLDPNCLVGNIHIRSVGFSKLWEICEVEGLRVLADVHTHPGASVAQSATDRENPMIARDEYLALIVPHFGTRPVVAQEVGVHQYRGNLGWKSWYGSEAERVLRIGEN